MVVTLCVAGSVTLFASCNWGAASDATPTTASQNARDSRSTQPVGRNPNIPAGTPSFRFGNIDYVLVNRSEIVNQYIPFGQTLDNWTSMFALRRFPGMTNPSDAVGNVTETLQADHPETMFKVTQDDVTGDRGIDFLIWTQDKQLSEFDVHIYQRRNGSVLGKMFLMRGYGEQGHYQLLKTVADTKQSLTKKIFSFDFPQFIQR